MGSAYIAGRADSSNFPTTEGAFDTSHNGFSDVFVMKLSAAGDALVYSTFLGGSTIEPANGHCSLAVDDLGNAYVTGETDSDNFPTTPGAFDTTFGGQSDGFVTKLNAAGSALLYSTYLGGGGTDNGQSIAVDGSGNAYVTGVTGSADFPTTLAGFDRTLSGESDAFVTKLNAAGSTLVYSTYLGGSGSDSGSDMSLDTVGSAYVTGATGSADYPVTTGAFDTTFNPLSDPRLRPVDAFVTKLSASGSSLAYSTYLGGSGQESGLGVVVDAAGSAYVTGPRVHIDVRVWHLDVGSSHPGAEAGPKGPAVRRLKRYVSWV